MLESTMANSQALAPLREGQSIGLTNGIRRAQSTDLKDFLSRGLRTDSLA